MSAPVSKKRKHGDMATTKYYAVRAGFKPGVYMTWPDCQAQTTGFKGASYKSFQTEQDAKDFVAGKSKSAPGQGKFYGVAVGHKPGVYTEWPEAELQILGAEKPKYKKFDTRKEAEEFVKSGGKVPVKKAEPVKAAAKAAKDKADGPSAKKVKTTRGGSTLKIYTDGSALGNGRKGAIAGVGVFFAVGDKRNVSSPLEGDVQTNNRAELTAVLRALEISISDRDIEIITDSNYSINCVTAWYKGWIARGWKKTGGGVVENQDLIKAIRKLIEKRDQLDMETKFTWVKGHDSDPGNTAADQLAVAASNAARL